VVEYALAYCLLDLSVGLFPRSTGSLNTLCCCIYFITVYWSIHQYVGEMFDVYNSRWVWILALEGSTSTKVQTGIRGYIVLAQSFHLAYSGGRKRGGHAGRHFAVGGI